MGSLLTSVVEGFLMLWDSLCSLISWLWSAVFSQALTLEGGHRVKTTRLLAEGGFGYVYLVQDIRTDQQFALKKMLCQTPEHLTGAKGEIRYHRQFHHPNLLPLVDSAIQHDNNKGITTVYLLFPFMAGGSLRDVINKRIIDGGGGEWGEASILRLFQGVLKGVKELHDSSPPLAHRDIKPENVLLHSDGVSPVLVDFGSMGPAEVRVTSRAQALGVQDEAATFSTMPYRAPELFDVPSDAVIDARVDVWSLGCLLFAMGYGYSPFESEFNDSGKMRVVECSYLRVIGKIPQDPLHRYSAAFEDLTRWMLQQDHRIRPTVVEVMSRVEAILESKSSPSHDPRASVALDFGWQDR